MAFPVTPRPVKWVLTFIVLSVLGLPLGLRAGLPFRTGDPDTVDPQHLEVIVGWAQERRDGERVNELPTFELNYGLADHIEVGYEAAWLDVKETGAPTLRGYSNSVLAAKWRFLDQARHGIDLALAPEFEFRTLGSSSAREGLVPDENTLGIQLRAQKSLGSVTVGASVGRTVPSRSDGGWDFGASVRRDLSEIVEAGIELVGEADRHVSHSVLLLNFGLVIKVGRDSELLIGVGRELRNPDEPKVTFAGYLGCLHRF